MVDEIYDYSRIYKKIIDGNYVSLSKELSEEEFKVVTNTIISQFKNNRYIFTLFDIRKPKVQVDQYIYSFIIVNLFNLLIKKSSDFEKIRIEFTYKFKLEIIVNFMGDPINQEDLFVVTENSKNIINLEPYIFDLYIIYKSLQLVNGSFFVLNDDGNKHVLKIVL